MAWTFNQREAVFLQIANRLRGEILSGKYAPHEQFPSVRQLASEAAVNPNTMQKALSCLEDEGILHSHGTVGRFVTSDMDILNAARCLMIKDTVKSILKETHKLGITTEELIKYITEEDKTYE